MGMPWKVDNAQDEEVWLRETLTQLLDESNTLLPPRTQRIGASEVSWWEGYPGWAVIMAKEGSVDDRTLAEQLVKIELERLGYRRMVFSFDVPSYMQKVGAWPDIMAKAKRLIQSGNVTMLRNGYYSVVGHVIGDHGEYNTEIGRDDPNSRAITTWQCECPWDQYAWQRTRQWKKYEGRPCAHVMALYWKSLATPLDDHADLSPEQQGTPGQKQPAPSPGAGPSVIPVSAPSAPVPQGQPSPFANEPEMGKPPPAQAPMAPPSDAGVLPPSPMEQLQQMQPPMPGATPGGLPAPPNSVSVPGAKPPSPFNPVQYPGGTYSAWEAVSADFNPPEIVRLKDDVYGKPEGPYATDQYMPIEAGRSGEVLGQDPTTGWVEIIVPLEGGPKTPQLVRCYVEPSQIEHTQQQPPGPFIKRHR